jgi:hypothetical protein
MYTLPEEKGKYFKSVTSDESHMFNPPKKTMLAKLETIFYDRYLLAEVPEEKLKYLRYFNHVVKLRNRLEFGL